MGFGAGRYLVTYSRVVDRPDLDLLGLRLAADGTPLDATPLLLSDLGAEPFLGPATARYSSGAVAFDGSRFGVVFLGTGTIGSEGPFGQVVAFTAVPPDGAPLLPATELVQEASIGMARTFLTGPISAASDGSRFVAVYQRGFQLVGAFTLFAVAGDFVTVTDGGVDVQETGTLGGANLAADPPMPASAGAAGVASNGTTTLAAWVETAFDIGGQETSTYLQGALIAPGEVRRIRLADATSGSGGTAIASDGTDFLVVWVATPEGDPMSLGEIRAIRFVPDGAGGGTAEPAGGFLVAGGPGLKQFGDVAFADGAYLVSWIEDGVVRGARVGTVGTSVAPLTIDGGPASGVALASDGERFLAVFDRENVDETADLLGTFVAVE